MDALSESPKEQLTARLDDPAVVESLNRLLDQLPLLSFAAEAASGFIRRSDVIIDNAARQFAEIREMSFMQSTPEWTESLPGLVKTGANLADAASRPAFNNLLNNGLIEELGKPETINLIKRLLDKLELIVFAVEAVDSFLRRGDAMMENARDSLRDVAKLAPSQDIIEQLSKLAASAPQLLALATGLLDAGLISKMNHLADAGDTIFNSGLLEPKKIAMISEVGEVLTETFEATKRDQQHGKTPKKLGIFDLIGLLNDPNIQASLALMLDFSRRYGQRVRTAASA